MNNNGTEVTKTGARHYIYTLFGNLYPQRPLISMVYETKTITSGGITNDWPQVYRIYARCRGRTKSTVEHARRTKFNPFQPEKLIKAWFFYW